LTQPTDTTSLYPQYVGSPKMDQFSIQSVGQFWMQFNNHKSNPQPASEWEEIAGKYIGQINAYCNALTSISGKPVTNAFVHLSVGGGIIEIGS
jgi:hypothetical protein